MRYTSDGGHRTVTRSSSVYTETVMQCVISMSNLSYQNLIGLFTIKSTLRARTLYVSANQHVVTEIFSLTW